MGGAPCRFCGSVNAPRSRFCSQCGSRYPERPVSAPIGPGFPPVWFQEDPVSPTPRRDVRWTLIVLGIAFLIVAILLLAIGAIVSSVVPAGSASCGAPPCSSVDPGLWFDWLGTPFLVLGIVLLALGLWWALR